MFLAHNAGFDVGFVAVAASRLKCKLPTQSVLDTCVLARQRWKLPNYRLETLGQHLKLIDVEKHRALDDALLLKEVFLHLVRTPPAWLHTRQLLGAAAPLTFDAFAAVPDRAPKGYERLWAAIDQGRVVEIQYLGGRTPGATRRITPHGVTEMRGQVYVAAFCHEGQCDKTFRLDRIGRYEVLDE